MKRIIRLTESDLTRIIRRVIMREEEEECPCKDGTWKSECCKTVELSDVNVSIMKFDFLKPKNGVRFVTYEPSTGNFYENGISGNKWAGTQPNLTRDQVLGWFKRNNIKVEKK